MKDLTRFFELSNHQKSLLIFLFLYIVRAELILKCLPYKTSLRFVYKKRKGQDLFVGNPIDALRCHLRLLNKLSRKLPWKPTCLRLATALRDSLCREGIDSNVKIGVCKKDGKIIAHAWLECCGIEVLKNGNYNELTQIG